MNSTTAFLSNIGPTELLIVLGILIIILGPKQIPKAAKSLGKGLRSFRESVEGKDDPEAELPQKAGKQTEAEANPDPDAPTEKDETRA